MDDIEVLEVEDSKMYQEYYGKILKYLDKTKEKDSLLIEFHFENNTCQSKIIRQEQNNPTPIIIFQSFTELEEVIKQHPDVAKINPHAINTVRVVTIVTTEDGKSILTVPKEERKNLKLVTHVICAYFRIGTGKRFVDNFNSNGMVAPVDEKTGVVTQVAIDKKKNTYVTHPETGSKIKGFQFPYWDKVLEMVDKAAKVVPEMGYAGWDVGFTPDGPLFVEGNEFPGHDIYQLPEHTPDKIGMMPKFNFEKE